MSQDLIDLDRRIVAKGGLCSFMRLAWDSVEPGARFVPSWHLRALCGVLEDVTHRRRTRVAINVPPGTGKSLTTGVFWPAWTWIHQPWHRWMNVSIDELLVTRDARKLLDLVSSRWFVDRWGPVVRSRNVPVSDFRTIHGGGRFSTSIRGKGIGHHAHTQVGDDLAKAKDFDSSELQLSWELWSNTFASRGIKGPNGEDFARAIIMQRIGEGDPSDRAVQSGYDHVCWPMLCELDRLDPLDERTTEGEPLWPGRYSVEDLELLRRETIIDGGYDAWETQYQQRPSAPGGQILRPEWFDVVSEADVPKHGQTIQSWDLSFKGKESSDYVAGQWWRAAWVGDELHFFCLGEPVNQRATFLETLALIRSKRSAWECSRIVVEDKANGPALEDVLSQEMPGSIELYDPRQASKSARVHSVSGRWALGRVHLVRGSYIDRWRKDFCAFPRVRRDDEVDAATQAIRYLDAGTSLFSRAMSMIRR